MVQECGKHAMTTVRCFIGPCARKGQRASAIFSCRSFRPAPTSQRHARAIPSHFHPITHSRQPGCSRCPSPCTRPNPLPTPAARAAQTTTWTDGTAVTFNAGAAVRADQPFTCYAAACDKDPGASVFCAWEQQACSDALPGFVCELPGVPL